MEVEPVLELFKQLEPYEFIMRFIVVCTEITNGIVNIIYLAEVLIQWLNVIQKYINKEWIDRYIFNSDGVVQ